MVARFLAPDLTQLAPAALIEEISADGIIAELISYVSATWKEIRVSRPDLPELDVLGLETEPMTILLQVIAYRESVLRALVNDKARAVLLAYATGSDLDHLGALFGTYRMTLVAATDTSPAIMESDDRFRRRIQLAPEAFSCAGPRGAYIYFALSLDLAIEDAYAFSPADGHVHVVVAGANGADVPDDVISALVDRFHRDDTVPMTDVITVRRAEIVPYSVDAIIQFPRGPDPAVIQAASEAAIRAYATERQRIFTTVFKSGLIAAGKAGGVENMLLIGPAADVVCGEAQVPVLSALTVATQVTG